MNLARRRLVAVVIAVQLVVAAGCSSTNIRDRERALDAGRTTDATERRENDDEPSNSESPGPDGEVTATTTPGSPPRRGQKDGAGGPGGATTPTQPGTVRRGPIPGGPGVTDTQINIGISLFKAGDYGASFGVDGVDFGNTEAQAQAVVDYINKNGGIGGRRIKPIYYTLDFGRPGLTDGQSEQEACAKWTEDNKVAAVLNSVMARWALIVCLAQRGVPGVHDGMPLDEENIALYRDYYYTTSGGPGLSLDRQAAAQVEVFGKQGFWNGTTVGIQYFEDKAYRRVVDEVFVPRLKKYGATKIVLQGAPRGGAEAASYAARFQREGVNRVLFIGEAALYPLLFMRAAENQLYFPKYGLNTDQQLAVTLQAGAPRRQLANSIAVGWHPIADTDADHDPGLPNAETKRCFDIQRAAAQDMSARGAAGTSLSYCSGLFFLKQAWDRATALNAAGLSQSVASIGASFVSGANYGTFFDARRRTGVSMYRDLVAPEGAFTYRGDPKPIPE